MFDHVSIGVADIARSKKFYDAALKPLGFTRLSDGETSLGYGEKAVQLWLGATGKPVPADTESGLHFCFLAPDRAAVEPSMLRRSRPAARTTASPACAPITGRNITPPSPSTPTATASRPIAENEGAIALVTK
jgi:catechol 2,3-dioxygenase-like lactoylglutathione lyase family enzyme